MPYIPKGILKRNWLEKHIRYDPAVVVIFYDCDWDDESWNEKISECSSRVQSIRLLFVLSILLDNFLNKTFLICDYIFFLFVSIL